MIFTEKSLKKRFGDKSYSIIKDYDNYILIKIFVPAYVSSLILKNIGIGATFIDNYIWILYDKVNSNEYLYFNELSKKMLDKLNEIRKYK